MENPIQISEDEMILVPIGDSIGDIRGTRQTITEGGGNKELSVKFEGFALGLTDPLQANTDTVSNQNIFLEFILSVLSEPSLPFKEILIEGELDGLKGKEAVTGSIDIEQMRPLKTDTPTAIERSELFSNQSDGTGESSSNLAGILKAIISKSNIGNRIKNVLHENTHTYDYALESYHSGRMFQWKLYPGSEKGINGEHHFFLWLTYSPGVDHVNLKIDLRAALEMPDGNKPLRLALKPQTRKKYYTIPIYYQEK